MLQDPSVEQIKTILQKYYEITVTNIIPLKKTDTLYFKIETEKKRAYLLRIKANIQLKKINAIHPFPKFTQLEFETQYLQHLASSNSPQINVPSMLPNINGKRYTIAKMGESVCIIIQRYIDGKESPSFLVKDNYTDQRLIQMGETLAKWHQKGKTFQWSGDKNWCESTFLFIKKRIESLKKSKNLFQTHGYFSKQGFNYLTKLLSKIDTKISPYQIKLKTYYSKNKDVSYGAIHGDCNGKNQLELINNNKLEIALVDTEHAMLGPFIFDLGKLKWVIKRDEILKHTDITAVYFQKILNAYTKIVPLNKEDISLIPYYAILEPLLEVLHLLFQAENSTDFFTNSNTYKHLIKKIQMAESALL